MQEPDAHQHQISYDFPGTGVQAESLNRGNARRPLTGLSCDSKSHRAVENSEPELL